MAERRLLKEVQVKTETGELSAPVKVGVESDNVLLTNFKDSADNKYTLTQLVSNYKQFMDEADFIYYGDEQPTNPRIKLWIDTTQPEIEEDEQD